MERIYFDYLCRRIDAQDEHIDRLIELAALFREESELGNKIMLAQQDHIRSLNTELAILKQKVELLYK